MITTECYGTCRLITFVTNALTGTHPASVQFSFSNQLTPRNSVLLVKLIVDQPVKKFSCVSWNPTVHYVFTTASHWAVS
jgi:hypothetical protein